MEPAGREVDEGRAARELRRWRGADDAQREAAGVDGAEADEIRRALGVESAFGYHIEDRARRRRLIGLPVAADAPDVQNTPSPQPVDAPAGPGAARGMDGRPFPCLDGHDYSGCLGLACPLETCWTGGATVSFARKMREESRVSTALYLPGAPCHACLHLVEDEVTVPAPRTDGPAERAGRSRHPGRAAGAGRMAATLRRVTCAQGLWAHPISLASFVTKRIPMLDQDEPESCPGYAPRPAPHPAVVAHLQRRRERARMRREEQRAAGADE